MPYKFLTAGTIFVHLNMFGNTPSVGSQIIKSVPPELAIDCLC